MHLADKDRQSKWKERIHHPLVATHYKCAFWCPSLFLHFNYYLVGPTHYSILMIMLSNISIWRVRIQFVSAKLVCQSYTLSENISHLPVTAFPQFIGLHHANNENLCVILIYETMLVGTTTTTSESCSSIIANSPILNGQCL